MNKIRTFLSLNINNTLREKVSQYQLEIKNILSEHNIKWESPEKFHMTLRFLGAIDEKNVENLVKDLDNIRFNFSKLLFLSDVIDFFPNKRKPNVIFFGLKGEEINTVNLTDGIDKVILKYGIKPDKKFVPHITLGRFRRENRLGVSDKNFPIIEPMNFEFDRFHLMKSVMDFRGSKYFVIKDFLFNK